MGLGEMNERDVWEDRREVELRKDWEHFLLDVGLSWIQGIFLLMEMAITGVAAVMEASPG